MKKLLMCMLVASLSASTMAQEKFETGKPGDDNYRYLDQYQALKDYIDYSKYPNFKLGAGTTVNDYLNNSTFKNLINKNFSETVAGNAMKMASCVDGNGNMNFETVKKYVQAATEAGLSVYGHTLAWHSQQPKAWLLKLIGDKPDPTSEETYTVVASKDFTKNQSVGWTSDKTDFGFSTNFDSTNGLIVKCTKQNTNAWDVQFQAMTDIPLTAGKTYKMTITVKGSKAGKMTGHLGDWNTNNDSDPATGFNISYDFTTDWQDIAIDVKPTIDGNFLLLQVNTVDFTGDVYIKNIKFEGNQGKMIPQTKQEMYDALVGAMDQWIKGMMEACNGKVKAWDLVNEAVSGGGDDGEGNYLLQHSTAYSPNGNPDATWDVGGDAFFWQDYLGDLDYIRQACRLARKYGPEDIKLFINDYNLESDWDDNKKLKSLINWIKKWEADGVTKIDGIGTQMHISYHEDSGILNSRKQHITKMFELLANSGKLVRVSEMDMGYVISGTYPNENKVYTNTITEAQHKKMAEFYEWIVKEYFRIIPPAQQWGICQWCPTDAPANSGWRASEPVGIWDLDFYRKHVYAGFVRGLAGGEPTAINGINADKTIDTSKGIYKINGVRMSEKSLSDLPSGLYIVNGKKVVK
ncbi:Carbohydrate binding domain-containing protein [Prevotella sp. khp7]|uniref:endo-1,4-beta-xylanase n=1 Tax=Prevotella sp. khp7 TaxID=1761885 RepID=UPI0008B80432|nr:endo-1,4-beta-xylanase [Prevotella sp. khp7]SEV82401.1 Carbohydrate binding domain-containing protein [Prevotella sp. khp7]